MSVPSFYWHDYETFGVSPSKDRPVQFAGVRTDLDFNIIGDPLTVYCKPADDFLPNPEACLVTGITPQLAIEKGVPEAEFARVIHKEMSVPATCTLGYNNLRFDDEVSRYLFYRNLIDPYAREWQNANSRWDMIDITRLTYALRPEGIQWPMYDDGLPSFKLEQLTAANNLTHESAHDALSDVYATIEIARLIRQHQPRLYDYVFSHRGKQQVLAMLNMQEKSPVLHTSSMFPSEYGCTAMVVPLASHPTNKNGIIVYDLRYDPSDLINEEPEEIAYRLFTPQSELPEDVSRVALKTIHINKSPVVVPLNTLNADAAKRTQIDIGLGMKHLKQLNDAGDLTHKIHQVFNELQFEPEDDPDFSLYGGGFFSASDRDEMNRIIRSPADNLQSLSVSFEDSRLPEMFFRYKARNYPAQLTEDEKLEWQQYKKEKLFDTTSSKGIGFAEFDHVMNEIKQRENLSDREQAILNDINHYRQNLEQSL